MSLIGYFVSKAMEDKDVLLESILLQWMQLSVAEEPLPIEVGVEDKEVCALTSVSASVNVAAAGVAAPARMDVNVEVVCEQANVNMDTTVVSVMEGADVKVEVPPVLVLMEECGCIEVVDTQGERSTITTSLCKACETDRLNGARLTDRREYTRVVFNLLSMGVSEYRLTAHTFSMDNSLWRAHKIIIVVDAGSRLCKGVHLNKKNEVMDCVFLGETSEFNLYAHSYFDVLKEVMCHERDTVLFYYKWISDGTVKELITGRLFVAASAWILSDERPGAWEGPLTGDAFVNAQSGVASLDVSGKAWFKKDREHVPRKLHARMMERICDWHDAGLKGGRGLGRDRGFVKENLVSFVRMQPIDIAAFYRARMVISNGMGHEKELEF